jgi:hypothetical protein
MLSTQSLSWVDALQAKYLKRLHLGCGKKFSRSDRWLKMLLATSHIYGVGMTMEIYLYIYLHSF